MDPMMDKKRGMLEELLKLAMEHRAMGLKSKLSPEPAPEAAEGMDSDVEMPGDPEDSASGMPEDAVSESEPSPDMLMKLLEMMGA